MRPSPAPGTSLAWWLCLGTDYWSLEVWMLEPDDSMRLGFSTVHGKTYPGDLACIPAR